MYHGTAWDLLRFSPNMNAQATRYSPYKHVSATLPILGANVCLDGQATTRAQGLIHVLVSDDDGELFGIWCFAEDIVYHE